jgi:ABC-2 type transport system permease protein
MTGTTLPHDTAVLLGRSLRHVTRSPDTIIATTLMPIAFLLLFVYVLGGAIELGTDSYVSYLLPGILVVTIASGVSYTAYRIFMDTRSGVLERLRSMPIARSSVLWAHVLTSVVANLVSMGVVLLVALLMGFRSHAGVLAWLAVCGILTLFTLALTWIAVIPGLTATTVDGAGAFAYPLILLPFVSSAFVPTDTMPGPVRAFAEGQPVTSVVDAVRELLAGQPVGPGLATAVVWCVGLLAVSYTLAMTLDRRRVGQRALGRRPDTPSAHHRLFEQMFDTLEHAQGANDTRRATLAAPGCARGPLRLLGGPPPSVRARARGAGRARRRGLLECRCGARGGHPRGRAAR